jgi:hypothetical protein
LNLLNLLRDSFAGINARFHLVGVSTLVSLLVPMAFIVAGEGDEWGPLVFMGLFVAYGVSFAIQGLVYHAAADPPGRPRPSGPRLGLLLFPTLLWLQARLLFLCYITPFLMVLAVQAARTGAVPDENWAKQAEFWVRIFAQGTSLVMTTAATPLAIRLREQGRRGRSIRDGLRFFAARRRETAMILALVVPAAVLGAVIEILRGPAATDPVPRIPEAFAIFVGSYLELVALFAASRVLTVGLPLDTRDAGRPGMADSSAAGPAA